MSTIIRGASPRPAGDSRFFGGEYMPWVTVGEVTKDENMLLDETVDFLTEQGAFSSRVIPADTLIMTNSGATLGVPKILNITSCVNDGVLAFLGLREDVLKEYLYFFLTSITSPLRERVKQGSGQPNLNTAIVSALPFPNPPFSEQQKIAAYLRKEWDRYSALIASSEHSIDLLHERRAALISAAVTGKIDVRSYVPSETMPLEEVLA